MKSIYILLFSLLWVLPQGASAQYRIYGRVLDSESQETVIGARVMVSGTDEGALTDLDGAFILETTYDLPLRLKVSSVGFLDQYVAVVDTAAYVEVSLDPLHTMREAVVVSASRVEERILEAPVSVERLGFLDFRYNPDPDLYGALNQLEGVMVNTSSLSYQSPNTRAFGNVQNWRFVQLVDGMDISGPGVNYAVGNLLRGSELDVRSVEVVPGPGSALYGPNAFNGLLETRTRNPFEHPGLSAYLRQGMAKMGELDQVTHPFFEAGLRYARRFDDRWALKFNLTYREADDWTAQDDSYLITNFDIPNRAALLATDPNSPTFNAVNRYGDETVAMIMLGDSSLIPVNRTGLREQDIVNQQTQQVFAQASLHYRITPTLEASYDFRFATADPIIRYENFYPFENYRVQYHKMELRGDKLLLRGYMGRDDAGDAYSVLSAGAIVQEGLKPTPLWATDYGAALRGEVPGIAAGDHPAARAFADRDIPGRESRAFQRLLEQTRSVPIDLPGGSAVVYQSQVVHADGLYDLSGDIPFVDVQVGGSYRRFTLDSRGHVYNDGTNGFGGPIPVWEFGAFAQASRQLLDDRLHLRASIRYDKNQAFEGQFTPRGSAVLFLGAEKGHAIRLSGQTGFRNPANQDTYVAFNAGPLIYLGNIEANIDQYSYEVGEQVYSGQEIYESLVTMNSLEAFMQGGGTDPSLLQPVNLDYLRQEQLTTFELGYRTLLANRLYADVHGFFNMYEDFTSNVLTFSPIAQKPFLLLSNIPETVYAYGGGVTLEGELPGGYEIGANYTYTTYDAADALAANPGYFPDFNFPEHMVKATFGNRDVYQGLGFQVRFRWMDTFTFQSPNGQGQVPSIAIFDGSVNYRLSAAKCLLKLGATNLFNETFTPVYGGPQIGARYYFQITFDEWLEGAPRR